MYRNKPPRPEPSKSRSWSPSYFSGGLTKTTSYVELDTIDSTGKLEDRAIYKPYVIIGKGTWFTVWVFKWDDYRKEKGPPKFLVVKKPYAINSSVRNIYMRLETVRHYVGASKFAGTRPLYYMIFADPIDTAGAEKFLPHRIKFDKEFLEETGPVRIVESYCPGWPLYKLVSQKEYTIVQKLKILLSIIEQLYLLHQHGRVHGDVKENNIIIEAKNDGSFFAWLIDFGLSHAINDEVECRLAIDYPDYIYHAPEIVLQEEKPKATKIKAHPSQDIYSFANMMGRLEDPCGVTWDILLEEEAPDVWDIMQQALNPNPADRPALTEIIECLRTNIATLEHTGSTLAMSVS